jgi:16S rRNA (guanine966-N2)-methyltransferase
VLCIQNNLHKTKFEDTGTLLKSDVLNAIGKIHEKEADIIYLDPPYESEVQKRALSLLAKAPYVTENTIIIVEAALATDFEYAEEMGLTVTRKKQYKTNMHVFLKKKM